FRANRVSFASTGKISTSNCTRSLWRLSQLGIEVSRQGDLICGMQATTSNQRAFATAEIHTVERKVRKPGVPVAFRQGEEQTLSLDAVAMPQQHANSLWTQGSHALHQRVGLVSPAG